MVNYATLAFALAAAAGLVSAAPTEPQTGLYSAPPTGTQDGTYLVSLNADGTTAYELLSASASPSPSPESTPQLTTRKNGIGCSNYGINASDLGTAQRNFNNMVGDGIWIYGKTVAQVYGSAIAFACNYNGGSNYYDRQAAEWSWNAIDKGCGSAQAGWNSNEDNDRSFGRVTNGSGYC
jgi:hypothetical protein